MARDPGDHLYRDAREQQRGVRKVTGGASGMSLATIMLLSLFAVGVLGLIVYFTISGSNPPPATIGQKDQATIPAPRASDTPR